MQRSVLHISVLVFLFLNLIQPCLGQDAGLVKDLMDEIAKGEYDTETVDQLIGQAYDYRNFEVDTSFMLCDLAIQLANELGYGTGLADAYYKKSLAFKSEGYTNEAILIANKALNIADSIQDSALIAKVNYNLANLYRKQGQNKTFEHHIDIAYRYYTLTGDEKNLAAVYNSLGIFYMDKGVYQAAAINYKKALDLAMKTGQEQAQLKIIANLSEIYFRMQEYNQAQKYLDKSLKIAKTIKEFDEQAIIYNRMGGVALEQGLYARADSLFQNSYTLNKQLKDFSGINNCLVNWGIMYNKQGLYDKAMANFMESLKYYRENNISEGMITVWHGMANNYKLRGNYDMAITYLDSCLVLSRQSENLDRRVNIYATLFDIYNLKGQLSEAFSYYRLWNETEDSINSLEKNQMLFQLNLMSEKEKYDLEKFIRHEERNSRLRQRNAYTYTLVGLVVLAIYLIIFFRYRARKNQIIAEQKVKQLEEEKKLLAARFLVEGQEEERKRIATELHDGLGALLSVTKMQFTAIKDVKPEDKSHYEKVAQFLEQASGDVRKISHNMMPGLLTKLGLCEALEDLFETLNDTEGMDARLEIVGPRERLPENKEIMIYRFIQEIVNNSLKHAEANKIDLTIIVHPDQLDISCSDNGKGFNRDEILEKKTIGIQSIHSRVRFLDGNICIDSSPGHGTVYRINIPLEAREN